MIYKGRWEIWGSYITACDYDFLLGEIEKNAKGKKALFISPTTSHILALSLFDPKLKESLFSADYLVPDSQWVKRALWLLYGVRLPDRVYGPELMLRTCALSQKRGFSIALYGGKTSTLKKLTRVLSKRFAKIKIVPTSKADVLFLGFGSPAQDKLAAEAGKKRGGGKIIIPVGAAFDFVSGVKRQAPKWMRDAGLEWGFRLFTEPLRLWKRYLIFASLFVLIVVLQKTLQITSRLAALFLIFLTLPIFALVFLAIKIEDGGTFLFEQKRMGKDRRPFSLYKFRTMVANAEKLKEKYKKLNEADSPVFKIYNDPRYTKVGKFLAHSGLDELPQLISIIKGEMNFIGPRPLPWNEALKVPRKYDRRYNVLPGITSRWVVEGAHRLSFERWMRLDLEYVQNRSLQKDAKIALQTISLIWRGIIGQIVKID